MLTMIGLPASLARTTSRQIVSDAVAEPPGLSMRKRMARTGASSAARRKARATVSAPMPPEVESGPLALSPRLMIPLP